MLLQLSISHFRDVFVSLNVVLCKAFLDRCSLDSFSHIRTPKFIYHLWHTIQKRSVHLVNIDISQACLLVFYKCSAQVLLNWSSLPGLDKEFVFANHVAICTYSILQYALYVYLYSVQGSIDSSVVSGQVHSLSPAPGY